MSEDPFTCENECSCTIDDVIKSSASHGYVDILRTLYKHDIDVISRDLEIMHQAAKHNHLAIFEWLEGIGAEFQEYAGNGAIRTAAEHGNLPIVEWLYERGADYTADDDDCLSRAASNGHLNVVEWLYNTRISTGQLTNDCSDRQSAEDKQEYWHDVLHDALASARQNDHFDIAEWLEEHGAV